MVANLLKNHKYRAEARSNSSWIPLTAKTQLKISFWLLLVYIMASMDRKNTIYIEVSWLWIYEYFVLQEEATIWKKVKDGATINNAFLKIFVDYCDESSGWVWKLNVKYIMMNVVPALIIRIACCPWLATFGNWTPTLSLSSSHLESLKWDYFYFTSIFLFLQKIFGSQQWIGWCVVCGNDDVDKFQNIIFLMPQML